MKSTSFASMMKIALLFLAAFLVGIWSAEVKMCTLKSGAKIEQGAALFHKKPCMKEYCNPNGSAYLRYMTCKSSGRPKCRVASRDGDRFYPYCCSEEDIHTCTEEERKEMQREAAEKEQQQREAREKNAQSVP